MKINKRKVNDVTVLDLSGDITIGEGDVKLRDTVKELLEQGEKNIILNLGNVKYIDSSGVGELVRCFTSVKNRGGELKLLNLMKKIREVLTITQLITIFDIYTDEKEAVESF